MLQKIIIAKQVITTFPMVTELKFITLDCGCIYYQRLLSDGEIGSQSGIYRNAKDGPCEICMQFQGNWDGRVVDESVVYNSQFQIN